MVACSGRCLLSACWLPRRAGPSGLLAGLRRVLGPLHRLSAVGLVGLVGLAAWPASGLALSVLSGLVGLAPLGLSCRSALVVSPAVVVSAGVPLAGVESAGVAAAAGCASAWAAGWTPASASVASGSTVGSVVATGVVTSAAGARHRPRRCLRSASPRRRPRCGLSLGIHGVGSDERRFRPVEPTPPWRGPGPRRRRRRMRGSASSGPRLPDRAAAGAAGGSSRTGS